MVLARREVSKDADTRGGPLGALGRSTLRAVTPTASVVPFNLNWYHVSMALNIKDPETERLAAEVAALTGTTKTGAVRYALRQVLQAQSRLSVQQREERLTRFLEEEIWPLVPPDQLGKPVSKAEREEILGFGDHGA
jgi:antitoxin VapB